MSARAGDYPWEVWTEETWVSPKDRQPLSLYSRHRSPKAADRALAEARGRYTHAELRFVPDRAKQWRGYEHG